MPFHLAEGEVLPLKFVMNLYVNELTVSALCTHQVPRSQMSLHSPSVIKSSDVGKVEGIKYDVTDCKDREVHLRGD